MARDDLRAVVDVGQRGGHRVDHPLEAASAREVHERVHPVEERVAHVDDVRAGEVDQGVAVGMGRRHVHHVDHLVVDVERHRRREGDDGERRPGAGRRLPVEHRVELLGAHPGAHVVVRHDDDPCAGHVLIAAGMIAVPVGVHQEPDRLVGHGLDGGEDFGGERRVLVVHQEGGLIAHRERDVAARAEQHVDALAGGYGLDRHRIQARLGGERRGGSGEKLDGECDAGSSGHGASPERE